jgi:hypothetical protein
MERIKIKIQGKYTVLYETPPGSLFGTRPFGTRPFSDSGFKDKKLEKL